MSGDIARTKTHTNQTRYEGDYFLFYKKRTQDSREVEALRDRERKIGYSPIKWRGKGA